MTAPRFVRFVRALAISSPIALMAACETPAAHDAGMLDCGMNGPRSCFCPMGQADGGPDAAVTPPMLEYVYDYPCNNADLANGCQTMVGSCQIPGGPLPPPELPA
jgi:hypothetical protein